MMTATSPASHSRVPRPESVTIKPLRLRFTFGEKVPRYWVDGDPFLTHFLNALSLAFPDGERFFVDSVRAVRDRIDDETLRKEVQGFIAQETMHGDAHEGLNAHLREQGYPMDELVGHVQALLGFGQRVLPKSAQLGITCGLEHVTALLGELVLGGPELPGLIHESMRPVWTWHAVEETEHKGVAFDVYDKVYGQAPGHHAERIATILVATAILIPAVHYFQGRLLARDGHRFAPKMWARGLAALYGRNGYLSRLAPQFACYARRDFHPWQNDNSALIRKWKPTLLA